MPVWCLVAELMAVGLHDKCKVWLSCCRLQDQCNRTSRLMVLWLLHMAVVHTQDQRTWWRRWRGWCWRGRRCGGRRCGLPG